MATSGDTVYAVLFAFFCILTCVGMVVLAGLLLRLLSSPNAGLGGIVGLIYLPILLGIAIVAVVAGFVLSRKMLRGEHGPFLTAGFLLFLPLVLLGHIGVALLPRYPLVIIPGGLWAFMAGAAVFRGTRGRWR